MADGFEIVTKKETTFVDNLDDNGNPILDSDGNPVQTPVESIIPLVADNRIRVRMTIAGHVLDQDIDMGSSDEEFQNNVQSAMEIVSQEILQRADKQDVPTYISDRIKKPLNR